MTPSCEILSVDSSLQIRTDYNKMVVALEGDYHCVTPTASNTRLFEGGVLFLAQGLDVEVTPMYPGKLLCVNCDPGQSPLSLNEKVLSNEVFDTSLVIDLGGRVRALFDFFADEFTTSYESDYLQYHFKSIVTHWVTEELAKQEALGSEGVGRLDVKKIELYVEANLDRKIQVSQLAQLCNMSVSRFHAAFRKSLNVTPYQYIINKRIEQAIWMLKSSDLTISEIAYKCGFSSRNSLNTQLARLFHKPPCQLRSELRAEQCV